LFSLLNHHKAEQIPFGPSKTGELKPNDQITIDNRTFTWGKVDRWTFENDTETASETAPEYNLYTYFTLGQSFTIFSCLVFLQFLAVFTFKFTRVKKFRQANILNKFIHSTDNLTIASPFEDFDVLDGTEKEHRERFQKVNTEVLMTMAVNMIFHLVMLAPLWYTASQVIARHELLQFTIGVLEAETDSYNMALYLPLDDLCCGSHIVTCRRIFPSLQLQVSPLGHLDQSPRRNHNIS